MHKGFNDTIKKETIVLSNLQGGNENSGLVDLLYGKNDYFISNPNENSMKFSNIVDAIFLCLYKQKLCVEIIITKFKIKIIVGY